MGAWLSVVVAAVVSFQPVPDLAGWWVLAGVPSAPDEASSMTVVLTYRSDDALRGLPVAIEHVMVARRLAGGETHDDYRVGIEGGTVGGISPGTSVPPPATFFWARFDGPRFVIYTERTPAGAREPDLQRTETWDVRPDGTMLVTITAGPPGIGPTVRSLVYRKEPPQ